MRVILFIGFFLFSFLSNGLTWSIESANKEITSNSGLNLVFCPLNYSDKEDFLRDTDILIRRLRQTKPFDEFIDKVRIWQVRMSRDEGEKTFKPTQDFPPLKVRKDFLDGITNRLKSNYKLIIIDAKGSVSCAELSSIDKMSLVILGRARYSNPHSFTKGFLHELGHSLGLRDECIDCGERCPPGKPNCAATREEAQKWWGDMVGKVERVNYIHGCCGNKNYIRPVIASLMNDTEKAEDFGPVNERFLRQELEKEK